MNLKGRYGVLNIETNTPAATIVLVTGLKATASREELKKGSLTEKVTVCFVRSITATLKSPLLATIAMFVSEFTSTFVGLPLPIGIRAIGVLDSRSITISASGSRR